MVKEKKCLKFTGYIYLPRNACLKDLRYFSGKTPGRLLIYDEFNNQPNNKMLAFDNLGMMIDYIEKAKQKRIYKNVKVKKNDI